MSMTPNISDLLNLKSFKNVNSDLASREVVDNLLLSYFAPMSSKEFPALEIGVFEGDSAVFLAESLQAQNRELVLIDNLAFLSSQEEQSRFISDVLMKKFRDLSLDSSRIQFICADSTTYKWKNEKFSFFHIDATSPETDIKTCLRLSNGSAIFAIDDFLVVPHHLEVVIKMILAGKIFPFAIGNKKIFLSDSKTMANELAARIEIWEDLDKVIRTESSLFFDHPIMKIYTRSSKLYHTRMAQYQV